MSVDSRSTCSTAADSLCMPAEWSRHRATWMAWPHNRETWPVNLAEAVAEFVEMVRFVAQAETVCMIASGEPLQQARRHLQDTPGVDFFDIPTNDAWIRDYGPTFVIDSAANKRVAVCWRYNGWGEKYPPFDSDQKVADRIADRFAGRIAARTVELVVEGGALEVDGRGSLLTTKSCLLNSNRRREDDPETKSRQDLLAKTFHQALGVDRIAWLSGGEIEGDDTDGHVDQQARFISDQTMVIANCLDPDDPAGPSLDRMAQEVEGWAGDHPTGFEIVRVPLPPPIHVGGQRIPASYLNFYFCNAGLIVPQFGHPKSDDRALSILRERLPNLTVIGLPSAHLSLGLGSFHCLTQQEPSMP